jgi:hypothetical protein
MKRILTFLLLLTITASYGQVKPSLFPEVSSIDNSNFEFYSQKDSSRRASVMTVKKAMVPDVDRTRTTAPDTTGNTLNLMEYLITPGDSVYYTDAAGVSVLLFNPALNIQSPSLSNDTLYLSQVNSGVYLGGIDTDAQAIDTHYVSNDTLYLSIERDGTVPEGIYLGAITGAGASLGDNGIEVSGSTVSLKTDTLSSDVTWTSRGSSGVFKIRPYGTSNNLQFLSNESAMSIGSNRNYTIWADTFRNDYIQANGTWTLHDLRTTKTGVEYADDYSSDFTDRSLVDKAYVDAQVEDKVSGVEAGTTDASGDITITHGLGTTPTVVTAIAEGTTPYILTVHTIGATTFKLRVSDTGGAVLGSSAINIHWEAK